MGRPSLTQPSPARHGPPLTFRASPPFLAHTASTKIKCGAVVRLQHIKTKQFLHRCAPAVDAARSAPCRSLTPPPPPPTAQPQVPVAPLAEPGGQRLLQRPAGQRQGCVRASPADARASPQAAHRTAFPPRHAADPAATAPLPLSPGDNWKVECEGTFWERDSIVTLKHKETNMVRLSPFVGPFPLSCPHRRS